MTELEQLETYGLRIADFGSSCTALEASPFLISEVGGCMDEQLLRRGIVLTAILPDDEFDEPFRRGFIGTGAYYKGGGRPWQLAHVRPGVCSLDHVSKSFGERQVLK